MSECRQWEELIDRSDDLGDDESKALLDHIDSCGSCAGLFDLVGRMRADDVVPDPGDARLVEMRRQVMRSIRRGDGETLGSRFAATLAAFFGRPALAIPALVILVAAGVLVGRLTVPGSSRSAASTTVAEGSHGAIASEIKLAAAKSRDIEDIENSPFTYSNVRVRETRGDTVAVSFDVSRHLDLDLRRDDPLLTDVLVQSLLQPEGVSTRLKAIDFATNLVDPRVRDALIRTMLGDPDLIVRMEAETRLVGEASSAELTAAFLKVLEREASVQMRLVAIDYLARNRVNRSTLEKAIDAGPDGRAAVFVRARDYLTNE